MAMARKGSRTKSWRALRAAMWTLLLASVCVAAECAASADDKINLAALHCLLDERRRRRAPALTLYSTVGVVRMRC
jgi:hypothetical protein